MGDSPRRGKCSNQHTLKFEYIVRFEGTATGSLRYTASGRMTPSLLGPSLRVPRISFNRQLASSAVAVAVAIFLL
jgi:hypothetical protein